MADLDVDLTDRDILIGILNLVGALAVKLTGEIPNVRIYDQNGSYLGTRPTFENVTWEVHQ